MHPYIGKRGEILGGAPRKTWFNLVGVDYPSLTHQLCQKSGVIATAATNMDDPFAFLWSKCCDTHGVQRRLPIVERSFAAKGDDNILIQNRRIIRQRLDVSRAGEDSPRGWPDKLLPWSRCERGGKLAARRNTSLRRYQIGEERSMCLYTIHIYFRPEQLIAPDRQC